MAPYRKKIMEVKSSEVLRKKYHWSWRTVALAFPKKTRRTRKYADPPFVPIQIRPLPEFTKNWRLDMLSQPNRYHVTPKYDYKPVEGVESGVQISAFQGVCSNRTHDLAQTAVRKLVDNRKHFKFLGQPFSKKIEKRIADSWATIYNYYKRSEMALGKKKSKSSVSSKGSKKSTKSTKSKKSHAEKMKEFMEWSLLRALPKPLPKPPRPPVRKVATLQDLMPSINKISQPLPRRIYKTLSQDSNYVDRTKVNPLCLSYVPTERIMELSQWAQCRLQLLPPLQPGLVQPNALTAIITPRMLELSIPVKKKEFVDTDVKENPYSVSKNALKYRPSARIQELAKPKER